MLRARRRMLRRRRLLRDRVRALLRGRFAVLRRERNHDHDDLAADGPEVVLLVGPAVIRL